MLLHPLPCPLPHHISQCHPTDVHCCSPRVQHTREWLCTRAQHTCYCCSLHLPQNISKYTEREIINHMKLHHPHVIALREVRCAALCYALTRR